MFNAILYVCPFLYQAIERGSDINVDEPTMRELLRAKERVQAYSQVVSQRLLEERTAHLQVSEVPYQDVLLDCALSKTLRWLRFQQRKTSGAQSHGGDQTLLGGEFYPGADLLITNLKPGRAALGPNAVGVLLACDSSTVKNLSTTGASSTVTPNKDQLTVASSLLGAGGVSATMPKSEVQVWTSSGLNVSSSLRSLTVSHSADSGSTVPGWEVSFQCLIIDWHSVETSPTGPRANTELKVFAMDAQRMGVVLTYPLPTDLVGRLPWLIKDQSVRVDCALLEHIDAPKDIVQVRRGERTVVSACAGACIGEPNSDFGVRNAGHIVSSAVKNSAAKSKVGNNMSGVKRVAFVPPVVTPGTAGTAESKRSRLQYASVSLSAAKLLPLEKNCPEITDPSATSFSLFETLPWVPEDERRRYASLRGCGQSFEPSRQPGDQEQCDRITIARASVKYTLSSKSVEDPHSPSEKAVEHVVIVDAVSRIEREAIVDTSLLTVLHGHCGGVAGQLLDPACEVCVVLTQCAHADACNPDTGSLLAPNEYHDKSDGGAANLPSTPSFAELNAMMNALERSGSSGEANSVSESYSTLCWKVVWMSPVQ